MAESQRGTKDSGTLNSKEKSIIEASLPAPFTFDYVEKQLRKKNFEIITTVTPEGRPRSVGVVYAMAPPSQQRFFCLYLITRPVLKKARNRCDNPNVSFVVPFPHYLFGSIPPRCIQFQGKAELLPMEDDDDDNDDPVVVKAFQRSIVLKRSMEHSLRLGESIFIRIVPDKKIFCLE